MHKITIGITCHNAAGSIANAVHSAFAQTHKNIEVLVVDDCSTDASRTILQDLQVQYPQLRVLLNQTNLGVAGSRNALLEAATGDFVAFFDDDDISDPTRLTKQLHAILAVENEGDSGQERMVVCHTARNQIFPQGNQSYCATLVAEPTPHGLPVALRILLGKPIPGAQHGAMATCSQMARLSTYQKLGGFDAYMRRSEDTDFTVRLALAGGYFTGLSEPLVTQNMTLNSSKKLIDEHTYWLYMLKKHQKIIADAGFDGFATRWATMKLAFLEGAYLNCARQAAALLLKYPRQSVLRLSWVMPNALENLKMGRFRRRISCL